MIGYDFSSTLAIILPVSVLISFLQIIYKNQLNKKLITEYNIYTLPFLIIFLIFSIKTSFFDIKLFVSVLLIISSFLALMKDKIYSFKKYILSYRKYILIYMCKSFAFRSSFGYNSSLREGKIYNFSSSEMLVYVLEINIDLVELLSVFRIHLKKYIKKYIIKKRFMKKIKLPRDLIKRELGLINFGKIIEKIEYEYENNYVKYR